MESGSLIAYKYQIPRPDGKGQMFLPNNPLTAEDLYQAILDSESPPAWYELIPASDPLTDKPPKQKPRFDIDMGEGHGLDDPDDYVRIAIQSILHVLRNNLEMAVYVSNVYVFTSHDLDSEAEYPKKSYHLVVDGVHHSNHHEAKEFYTMVKKELLKYTSEDPDNCFLDSAVYKSSQLFRLEGCAKMGSNRVKVHVPLFKLSETSCIDHTAREGETTHEHKLRIFKAGLVTHCPSTEHIPITYTEKDSHTQSAAEGAPEISGAVEIMISLFGDAIEYSKVVEGGVLLFTNLSGIDCPMCKRTHRNENPFLTLTRHDSAPPGIMNVLFNCRRRGRGFGKAAMRIGLTTVWGQSLTLDPRRRRDPNAENEFISKVQVKLAERYHKLRDLAYQHLLEQTEERKDALKKAVEQQESTTSGLFVTPDDEQIRVIRGDRTSSSNTEEIPCSIRFKGPPLKGENRESLYTITHFHVSARMIVANITERWQNDGVWEATIPNFPLTRSIFNPEIPTEWMLRKAREY